MWMTIFQLNVSKLIMAWCRHVASILGPTVVGHLYLSYLHPPPPPPNYYLNQCWLTVHWTLRKKLQWNFNRNSNFRIEENAFDHNISKQSVIVFRNQFVKQMKPGTRRECGMCIIASAYHHFPEQSVRLMLVELFINYSVFSDPNQWASHGLIVLPPFCCGSFLSHKYLYNFAFPIACSGEKKLL